MERQSKIQTLKQKKNKTTGTETVVPAASRLRETTYLQKKQLVWWDSAETRFLWRHWSSSLYALFVEAQLCWDTRWVLIWAEKHTWLCAHTCFYVFGHSEKQRNVNRVSMQHVISFLFPLVNHRSCSSAFWSSGMTFDLWLYCSERFLDICVSVRKKEALFSFLFFTNSDVKPTFVSNFTSQL